MTHCCSQCSFTANFESALTMHHQLHHPTEDGYLDKSNVFKAQGSYEYVAPPKISDVLKEKSKTSPRSSKDRSHYENREHKSLKLLTRTSSATRLLGKLRARITRSKTLFSHPEESVENFHDVSLNSKIVTEINQPSQILNKSPSISRKISSTDIQDGKETYGCHLCSFDANRITVLDRHLLNDHKIGLDDLLKLVMSKTKDGLSDEPSKDYGIRQPYYRPQNEIIEEGEFIIVTEAPKIKILKHAATNTDNYFKFKIVREEIENISKSIEKCDKNELIEKMQVLNEYMCKYVDSTKTIKNVLDKGLESNKSTLIRLQESILRDDSFFRLGLGDQETSRSWGRAHSDKMEHRRHKSNESSSRGEKSKGYSDSFYF